MHNRRHKVSRSLCVRKLLLFMGLAIDGHFVMSISYITKYHESHYGGILDNHRGI